mmetsp:Transcript_15593/g.20317  ORF Transcript_15593/g.20317 Transcript_15593/m.20317 type:complete len:288 (+) Transcript_15593:115-978(+)
MSTRATVVFRIYSVIALIYGLLSAFSPKTLWYGLLAPPKGSSADSDLDYIFDFHSTLVHKSAGIFTCVLALFAHTARKFEPWEQAIVSKYLVLGSSTEASIFCWQVLNPDYPELTTAYWRFAVLFGCLTLALSWALLEEVPPRPKQTKIAVAAWEPLAIGQSVHFWIGFPFGVASVVWPRSLYLALKPFGIADSSTPFELFGIQCFGCCIISITNLARNIKMFSFKSQLAFAYIMLTAFIGTTMLYLAERQNLNILYTFGGIPPFATIAACYGYGIMFQPPEKKKES